MELEIHKKPDSNVASNSSTNHIYIEGDKAKKNLSNMHIHHHLSPRNTDGTNSTK